MKTTSTLATTHNRIAFTQLEWVGLLLLVSLSITSAALGQGRDFSAVEMKTTKLTDTVYMIEGAGGNLGVSAGEDGILLIDDQFLELADKIEAAIAEIKAGDIDYLINPHWHFDHAGGNEKFGLEAAILAHENVRSRLAAGAEAPRPVPPAPKSALPVLTFEDSVSLHWNGEEVDVIHFPTAHTDGDSVIFFKGSNVVHMGDHFFNNGGFPFVDLASGGNALGLRDNIGKVLGMVDGDTQIIPGHGPLGNKGDLAKYHEMLEATIGIVEKGKRAGKSLEELQKEGLPAPWDSYGGAFIDEPSWIGFVYNSLP